MFCHSSRSFCLGLLGLLAISQAHAGISLSATRLVFDGKHKEAGITVRNNGEDVLIQSWIDTDAADSTSVPFAVTPPLVRVAGNEQQLLRVIYEGTGMPSEKSRWSGSMSRKSPRHRRHKTPCSLRFANVSRCSSGLPG